jgi:hypothetical protein
MILVSRSGSLDFRFGDPNEGVATLDQVVRTDHYRFREQLGRFGESSGGIVKMFLARAIATAFVIH